LAVLPNCRRYAIRSGTEALIRSQGLFRIVDGDSEIVIIKRLEGAGHFEHAPDRSLVLEHLLGFSYTSSIANPGKLFLSDVVGRRFRIKPDQSVWARQLGIEGSIEGNAKVPARVVNEGGRFGAGIQDRRRGDAYQDDR
jgi:hypothetical protein